VNVEVVQCGRDRSAGRWCGAVPDHQLGWQDVVLRHMRDAGARVGDRRGESGGRGLALGFDVLVDCGEGGSQLGGQRIVVEADD